MFLSRIELGPRAAEHDAFWREVSQPYGAHQALWRLLARGPDQRRDFLFRVEEGFGPRSFYVLSAGEPADDRSGLWCIQSRPFAPVLAGGQRLGFRLRASPVVRRGEEVEGTAKRRVRRHDVVMDEAKRAGPGASGGDRAQRVRAAGLRWLAGQGSRAGFRLVEQEAEGVGDDGLLEARADVAASVDGYRQHRIVRRGATPIRFSTIDYEGVLEVTDPTLFLAKVAAGFGPQKAFGCGLMLLRRA